MYSIADQVDDIDAAVRDLRAKGVLVSDAEYGAWPGTRVARINKRRDERRLDPARRSAARTSSSTPPTLVDTRRVSITATPLL